MWKVLRRYQGESYSEPAAHAGLNTTDQVPEPQYTFDADGQLDIHNPANDNFIRNQRTIAGHQCRPFGKPHDPMNLTVPYGNLVYSKMVLHLSHENVEMRRKALRHLLELYNFKGEHVVASLKDGALDALVTCLNDEDEEVRVNSCVALEMIAQQPTGQDYILKDSKYLQKFIETVDDSSVEVVAEGLRLLWCSHLAYNEFACTKGLIKLGCIDKYVERVSHPSDDVSCMALAALGKVFDIKEAFISVLDSNAMEVITNALETRQDPNLLVEAAECAGKLCFYSAGKRAAVQSKTCVALLPLLNHDLPAVRISSSGALVAVTINEAGKLQAIDNDIVIVLIEALKHETERDVLVNEVKTCCNISEQPQARLQLHRTLERLEEIAGIGSEYPSLVESVQRAIAMIRWQPGDAY